jgi:hydroxymethyl cephem carbamoyltransferase
MLIMGIHPGHDGAIAAVKDRKLLFHLEAEKDSFERHAKLTPMRMLDAMKRLDQVPDVVAVGGSVKEQWWFPGANPLIEAGYLGSRVLSKSEGSFLGKPVTLFSSSHIRSHIMTATGMAPKDEGERRAVLVWEGDEGTFYLLDERWAIVRELPVLRFPGGRYVLTYAIASEDYRDETVEAHGDEAGKLMALAAYGDPADANAGVIAAIDQLLAPDGYMPKGRFSDAPFYNKGVEADVSKVAAAVLQQRMFDVFARVAQRELPRDIPLYISGGCGLNCDWNTLWRELGHFSSVFVPPCPNDAGSALGTALDALHTVTGDPRIEWDAYAGLDFERDGEPDPSKWKGRSMEYGALADALAGGRIVAWVQGRWEMGPRALGNRSLLAEPFSPRMRDLLNEIKMREGYRPIAPVCRIEDAGKVFDRDFHDPYMLYFRRVRTQDLGAVTHVDGSARAQTVTRESNKPLHELLCAFAERRGVGVLCNTSLNYQRMGFINRMSDLADYCEQRGVTDMVVGDSWFQRVEAPV